MRIHTVYYKHTRSCPKSTVFDSEIRGALVLSVSVSSLLMEHFNNTGGAVCIIHRIHVSSHFAQFALSTSSEQDAGTNIRTDTHTICINVADCE